MSIAKEGMKQNTFKQLLGWLDSDGIRSKSEVIRQAPESHWSGYIPFAFMHLGCLGALLVGWSPVAVGLAFAFYWIRVFAITAFYHRYFSHRTFQTSRFWQAMFAVLGMTAVQRGPLWWASHHRYHHQYSDQQEDLHSPARKGLWWSHIGWITCSENLVTDYERIPDLVKFPELVWLNRFDWLVPLAFAGVLYLLGEGLNALYPGLHTSGWQMIVWVFFISTVFLFHATCTINSLSHLLGKQRFASKDDSRNNFILAMITMGEGWHNNHHRYPGSARQGFYWWEIDMSYYVLKVMSWLGIVWDLHPVPQSIYQEASARSQQK